MKSWAALAFVLAAFGPQMPKEPEKGRIAVEYREVMIPMRDGVRLQTVIILFKDAKGPLPILLRRTPYGVPEKSVVEKVFSSDPGADQWITVIQNLRGRFKSEGKFVMQRPPHDPADKNGVDETTDAWDTVEWLIHNVPNNNGKVGLHGTSYDAWTAVMAALDPHPAVKAIIEQASPADMFLGDDFHHNGAFRLSYGFEYSALLETTAAENYHFQFDRADTYEWYLNLGPLRNADARYFHGKIPTWQDFVSHPNDDAFWKRQTVISYIHDVKTPILHVAGWWDQEDFYGPQQIYAAMEKFDHNHWNYFVAGPWNHGQWNRDAARLGPVEFGSDTAKWYRDKIWTPWFQYWLRGEGTLKLPEATTFETGTNQWREYEAWPPAQQVEEKRLYLAAGRKLSFDAAGASDKQSYDEYVSDPANPVPYRPRPVTPTYPGPEWPVWLVQDQRFVDHRPDVLSYETEPLASNLRVTGDIVAKLVASTSGTDSDWVVKLIDVYPEDAPDDKETHAKMGGYQLIIADEIFRGRFRNGFEHPAPLKPNEPLAYTIDLHTNDHVFRKGHRVMVQVQSTWFPVYDRNPQTFVLNIFEASAADYRKATQRVYHSSAIVLPVVSAP
ncbi:MAG TPA: CocE/NonD family hydrolase [Bryobacteraceae bacterium]|jgi:putative CocE/NonD family hydrolase|nr:CocE/NonD family hydrolase [Bryobacteraceae bacterium]